MLRSLLRTMFVAGALASDGKNVSISPPPGCSSMREIKVDAGNVTGQLKNFQGINNAYTPFTGDTGNFSIGNDHIYDFDPSIASLWPEYGVQHVLMYNFPDVFMGFGKNGSAGDAMSNDNYNWTTADEYMRFVISHGATVSINFALPNGMNNSVSSPEKLGQIGYMITDRYVNGAHNSGFITSIELFDFYAESDLTNSLTPMEDYETSFAYFAAFSRAVTNASSSTGVGAWGGNRIPQPHTNYTVPNPYVARFYRDCVEQKVPIKAATYHFTNTQFSFDPYDVKLVTDAFRRDILIPADLPDLPIWITEYEPNPNGALPTSAQALKDYNDPSFFAAFMLAVSMYAQSTPLAQALPWTGLGHGGYGAGHAWFHSWFNLDGPASNSSFPVPAGGAAMPRPIASAWKLQASLVMATPSRLSLSLPASQEGDGFVALGGRDVKGGRVNVLVNNYQLNYDIPREITAALAPIINTTAAASPLLQPNGLLNGEQACFNRGNPQFGLAICQTLVPPRIRNNTADSYHLSLTNLPWSNSTNHRLLIQRVDGNASDALEGIKVFMNVTGVGNTVDFVVPFYKNSQDLVSVERLGALGPDGRVGG